MNPIDRGARGIISGFDTLDRERGWLRGIKDFEIGETKPQSQWPEPFRAGWAIGWAEAKKKATKGTNILDGPKEN